MCSNYLPVTRADRLMTFFGVEYAKEELLHCEVFPLGMAPFIRLTVEGQEGGKPALVAEDGMFGLLPHFVAEQQYGRRTYNARSETVHMKLSFKPLWEAGQRCTIPADGGVEPGTAVRWRISQGGAIPQGTLARAATAGFAAIARAVSSYVKRSCMSLAGSSRAEPPSGLTSQTKSCLSSDSNKRCTFSSRNPL